MSTLAAAQRIVATVVCNSAFAAGVVVGILSPCVDIAFENELRRRCEGGGRFKGIVVRRPGNLRDAAELEKLKKVGFWTVCSS